MRKFTGFWIVLALLCFAGCATTKPVVVKPECQSAVTQLQKQVTTQAAQLQTVKKERNNLALILIVTVGAVAFLNRTTLEKYFPLTKSIVVKIYTTIKTVVTAIVTAIEGIFKPKPKQ